MNKNLVLFNNNPALDTIEKFIKFYKLRVIKKKVKNNKGELVGFTEDEFFEYNREIIFNQLTQEQLLFIAMAKGVTVNSLSSRDIDKKIKLPCPGYLHIEAKYVNYAASVKNTNFQAQVTDVIAFEDEEIRKILQEDTIDITYGVKRQCPGCRVVGWFKSMYYDEKANNENKNGVENIYDSSQNFWDVSRFVVDLNTTVNESGGNFTISFPHIPLYPGNFNGEMMLRFIGKSGFNYDSFVNSKDYENFFFEGNELMAKADMNSFNFFEWLIQSNDLLFLSFDRMDDLVDDNLAGKTYDMIGLVDTITVNRNANGTVNVDVSGRDLMKLITDDASMFFPAAVSAGTRNIFNNTETTMKGGDLDGVYRYNGTDKKNMSTNRQLTPFLKIFAEEPNYFNIDFVLKTVVSHLVNLQVVPDDLFTAWGDRRTTYQTLKPKSEENGGN